MFSLKITSTSFNLNNAHKGKKEKKKRFPHIKALPFTDSTLQSLYRTLWNRNWHENYEDKIMCTSTSTLVHSELIHCNLWLSVFVKVDWAECELYLFIIFHFFHFLLFETSFWYRGPRVPILYKKKKRKIFGGRLWMALTVNLGFGVGSRFSNRLKNILSCQLFTSYFSPCENVEITVNSLWLICLGWGIVACCWPRSDHYTAAQTYASTLLRVVDIWATNMEFKEADQVIYYRDDITSTSASHTSCCVKSMQSTSTFTDSNLICFW